MSRPNNNFNMIIGKAIQKLQELKFRKEKLHEINFAAAGFLKQLVLRVTTTI